MIEKAFNEFPQPLAQPAAELASVENARVNREKMAMQYLGLVAAELVRAAGMPISGWKVDNKKDRLWVEHELRRQAEAAEQLDITSAA